MEDLPEIKKIYNINQIGVSGVTIQFCTVKIIPLLAKFVKSPNKLTFLSLVCTPFIFYFIAQGNRMASVLIILTLFVDLADGYLARYTNKVSLKGAIFDALVDVWIYIWILIGLFLWTRSIYVFLIVTSYCVVKYCDLLMATHIKTTINGKKISESEQSFYRAVKWMVKKLDLLFSHFDALMILSIILLVNKSYIYVWIFYELIRRVFQAMKGIASIYMYAGKS